MSTTNEADIAVSGKTQRILAFDLIRGLFLLIILIDHVELYPSGWDILTGRGRLFVSAAEGFFFMSGLLIGMMYRRRLALGMKFIFLKMWRRALQLYLAGTALTLIYLGWVVLTHHTPVKDSLPSPFPWSHYLPQILSMRFTYGWADFLVRFAILMLIAPFVFYIIAKGRWKLALLLIFGAWLLRGQNFTLAWQLIFNGAMIVGFYWQSIEAYFKSLKQNTKRRLKNWLFGLSAISFAISYASVYLLSLLNQNYAQLSPWLRHFTFTWNNYNADIWVYAQKWTLGPLRIILFMLWASTLYFLVRRYEITIGRATHGLLELLGRNSLFVYVAHSVIIFILKMYVIPPITSLWQNFLITMAALVLLVLTVVVYKRAQPHFKALLASKTA